MEELYMQHKVSLFFFFLSYKGGPRGKVEIWYLLFSGLGYTYFLPLELQVPVNPAVLPVEQSRLLLPTQTHAEKKKTFWSSNFMAYLTSTDQVAFYSWSLSEPTHGHLLTSFYLLKHINIIVDLGSLQAS